MKTCLVTTIFLDNKIYQEKLIKLLGYYLTEVQGLKFDHLYIIDNASDVKEIQKIEALVTGEPVSFIRYTEHFDRPSHLDYKYLWRNVYTWKDIFKQGYEKIIYVDSDFYLLSKKSVDYVNNVSSGWHTYFCPKYSFPETGISIVTKNCQEYKDFVNKPWDEFVKENNNTTMEWALPVTHVEKNLIGDRFDEYPKAVPDDCDFAAQVALETKVKFKDE